jgi:arginyl-tRNA synthetase
MDLFAFFRQEVLAAVADLGKAGDVPPNIDTSAIAVEPPRDPRHGDVATNAALVLAKATGLDPRQLAEPIAARLRRHPDIATVSIAGPGFINLTLKTAFWRERLRDVLAAGPAYGDSNVGQGVAVNVEYVSANPTGPLHVGHGRGAVFGDALANLLEKVGFKVTREYYVNDSGVGLEKYDLRASGQIETLARSIYHRYQARFATVRPMPERFYTGEYLIPVAEELVTKYGDALLGFPERGEDDPKKGWMELCANAGVEAMMKLIRADLEALDIHFEDNQFIYERDLHRQGKVEAAINVLKEKENDLIYEGELAPPKGQAPEDWEPATQLLFRATYFGDDTDRPLKKRYRQPDESWTYFAADIAYHYDKFQRGFKHMIDVWGADHAGYVKRVKAAVKALTDGEAELDVKICQLVNTLEAGVPVKMSKRAGSFLTLAEVIDRVGRDVVRFIMLTRRNDAPLDFDFVKVTEQSKDNPVFYVQYAHARVCSLMRRVREIMPDLDVTDPALRQADFSPLVHPAELSLMKTMATWPRIVETAAEAHEPHRIAFYLYDLAAAFHELWTLGKGEGGLRFIIEGDPKLSAARLGLARAVATVIQSGFKIIGIAPVEEMR